MEGAGAAASRELSPFEAFALHDAARSGAAERLCELASVVEGKLVPAMAAHAEGLLHGDGAALDAAAATFTERGGELSWRPRVDRELRREPDAGAGIG